MKIRLNASEQLVGYFEMPHYNPPPDVVTYKSRVFKMRTIGGRPMEPHEYDDCAYVYDECSCIEIVTERKDS